jgi:hypothetical protein
MRRRDHHGQVVCGGAIPGLGVWRRDSHRVVVISVGYVEHTPHPLTSLTPWSSLLARGLATHRVDSPRCAPTVSGRGTTTRTVPSPSPALAWCASSCRPTLTTTACALVHAGAAGQQHGPWNSSAGSYKAYDRNYIRSWWVMTVDEQERLRSQPSLLDLCGRCGAWRPRASATSDSSARSPSSLLRQARHTGGHHGHLRILGERQCGTAPGPPQHP